MTKAAYEIPEGVKTRLHRRWKGYYSLLVERAKAIGIDVTWGELGYKASVASITDWQNNRIEGGSKDNPEIALGSLWEELEDQITTARTLQTYVEAALLYNPKTVDENDFLPF